ncbi:MAG: ABC transporter ATP-binding protein [Deltaproteobacteria bacterium]|nr:ABC transporter ATP-binding protein [Deltaproteobacteria bacterium]
MIRTNNLSKTYGDFDALRGISLHVQEGDIYGFIGPNGAGKTTTIKILTTLLEPTTGDAFVDGKSVWDQKDAIRGLIGYMPDAFGVYPDMTVNEYLHFFAAAYGIARSERQGLVDGLLELTDLSFKEDALVDSLSKGMQQRLGLARALVHDPKVLILDEPAAGLDPRARVELREILRELQNMGKTILLSSHILSELQDICNRVGIIERGVVVAEGSVEEILDRLSHAGRITLRTDDDERALQILGGHEAVGSSGVDEESGVLWVTFRDPEDDLALLGRVLGAEGVGLRFLDRDRVSLEEAFMKLTQGLVQ